MSLQHETALGNAWLGTEIRCVAVTSTTPTFPHVQEKQPPVNPQGPKTNSSRTSHVSAAAASSLDAPHPTTAPLSPHGLRRCSHLWPQHASCRSCLYAGGRAARSRSSLHHHLPAEWCSPPVLESRRWEEDVVVGSEGG